MVTCGSAVPNISTEWSGFELVRVGVVTMGTGELRT